MIQWKKIPATYWEPLKSFAYNSNNFIFLSSQLSIDQRSEFDFLAFQPLVTIEFYQHEVKILSEKQSDSYPLSEGFNQLKQLQNKYSEFPLFLIMGYEIHTMFLEKPVPSHPIKRKIGWGIIPEVFVKKNHSTGDVLISGNTDVDFSQIIKCQIEVHTVDEPAVQEKILSFEVDQEFYEFQVNKIINYISNGDTYELNFCHGYYGKIEKLNSDSIFKKLSTLSPSNFAVYSKLSTSFFISSSPERFFKIVDGKIVCQPMKGTRARQFQPILDEKIKQDLKTSEKDKAENLMIVDLMRNDLGQICQPGSIQVTDLFQVETYSTVHQMISTIEGKLNSELSALDVIKHLFPAGSMTGAPKHHTMELITELEAFPRGLFSGISGYILPDGQSEFSVNIRCIEGENDQFWVKAGGAITADSIPIEEFKESLLKMKATTQALGFSDFSQSV